MSAYVLVIPIHLLTGERGVPVCRDAQPFAVHDTRRNPLQAFGSQGIVCVLSATMCRQRSLQKRIIKDTRASAKVDAPQERRLQQAPRPPETIITADFEKALRELLNLRNMVRAEILWESTRSISQRETKPSKQCPQGPTGLQEIICRSISSGRPPRLGDGGISSPGDLPRDNKDSINYSVNMTGERDTRSHGRKQGEVLQVCGRLTDT